MSDTTSTPADPAATPVAKPAAIPAHHPRKLYRQGALYLERQASKLKIRKKRPGR